LQQSKQHVQITRVSTVQLVHRLTDSISIYSSLYFSISLSVSSLPAALYVCTVGCRHVNVEYSSERDDQRQHATFQSNLYQTDLAHLGAAIAMSRRRRRRRWGGRVGEREATEINRRERERANEKRRGE
jgi:hypothetical protein